MPSPTFLRLNEGWNAHPNAPAAVVAVGGSTVRLHFFLNHFAFRAKEDETGCLTFMQCTRWRMGATNDHGWHTGQCRYSETAPEWGEFYELLGADDRRLAPTDWEVLAPGATEARHFLFYLRDETFECIATDWTFDRAG